MKRRFAVLCVLLLGCALSAAAQARPVGIRTAEAGMRVLRIKKVDPVYPPLAIQSHVQGQVVFKVKITKLGDVASVELVSGHPLFAQPAIDAVKQWKYKPFLLNGEPCDVETVVRLDFILKETGEGVVADAPVEAGPGKPHTSVPRRVRVSAGVAAGLLWLKVKPEYPPEAKKQHIEGAVILRATIDKKGNVSNLQAISGDPLLVPAAIAAVKKWKYLTYLINGEPVEVETEIQVNFKLPE